MRILIAVLLLFLLATQAFPVSAWSKSCVEKQLSITDESGDEDEGPSVPKGGKVKKQTLSEEDYDHSNCHSSQVYTGRIARQENLHRHDFLYGLYSGEVTTPPPNYC